MFREDVNIFLMEFADNYIYSDGTYSKEIRAIIDYDVQLFGYEGQVIGQTTTFTFESDNDVVIGGTITINDGTSYLIDSVVSDDKVIKTVSAVEQ